MITRDYPMRHRHGRRRCVARTVAFCVGAYAAPLASLAATDAAWQAPVSGNWTEGAKWTTAPQYPNNGTPAPGDTYNVVAGGEGAYTLNANAAAAPGGLITVDNLTLTGAGANLSLSSGTLQVLQDLSVDRGTFRLAGGTLRGASVGGAGGEFRAESGTLDRVTLRRNRLIGNNTSWTYPPELHVRNGITLDGATVVLDQFNTSLGYTGVQFDGTQSIGGSGTMVFQGTRRPFLRVNGGTLTVGRDVVWRGAGEVNYDESGIVNLGTIRAESTIQPFLFMQGDARDVLVNRGLMEARAGGRLIIEGALDNREGVIRADGAEVSIGASRTSALTRHTSNFGTLEAANGGWFLLAGPIDNTNATFTARAGVPIELATATVTGGRLATEGTGEFFVSSSTTTLRDLTIAGRFALRPKTASNGPGVNLAGIDLDGGVIELHGIDSGFGANAYLTSNINQTIGGTGEIVFHGRGERGALGGSGTLTLGPGITVRTGTGGGGVSGGAVINQGTLSSETPGQTLRLSRVWNEGTLQALNYGLLAADDLTNTTSVNANHGRLLLGGTWTNAGGTINAVNDSDVELASVPADFGTFTLTDSTLALGGRATFKTPQFANKVHLTRGMLSVRPGATLDNAGATLSLSGYDLRLEGGTVSGGTVATGPGGGRITGGSGVLSGVRLASEFRVNGFPRARDLELASSQVSLEGGVLQVEGTLRGTGGLVFNVGGAGPGEASFLGATVTPGVTVRTGTRGGTVSGSLTNQGTISASGGHPLTVSASVNNQGVIEARDGGILRAPRFSGELRGGTWAVYAGSTIDFGANTSITTNRANVILDGPDSMLAAVSPMETNAGGFTLAGGRDFESTARRGLTNVGTLALSAATDLHARSFAQDPSGTLRVEIAGPGGEAASHLLIDGAASLHGVLGITVLDGFAPVFGDEYEILSAGLVSGRFSGLTTTGLAPGTGHFEPVYAERRVTLRFLEGPAALTVPEPSTLLALPATALALRRRRRREALQRPTAVVSLSNA